MDYQQRKTVKIIKSSIEDLKTVQNKLETINKETCTGCYFTDNVRRKYGRAKFSCYVHGMACTKHLRKDRKHVIFKPV